MALESIALIPSGYKANKLYCQLPVDGGADLTTSRASGATRVNKNGLIEDVATGVPRLDYTNGGCPELLLEPQSTNLVTYSEDFSQAYWAKNGGVIATSGVISPKGDLSAYNMSGLTGSGSNDLICSYITNPANRTFTYSVYLKGSGTLRIQLTNSVDDSASTIVTLSNEWTRFELTKTFNATTAASIGVVHDDSGATATEYDIWGAQLEELSYSTSYIRTSGTTATRIADAVSGNSSLGQVINSSEGVLYAEMSALADDLTFRSISINNGSNSVLVELRYRTTTNRINFLIKDGVNPDINESYVMSDITDNAKFAVKYKSGDIAFWVNGTEVFTATNTISISGLDTLSFNNDGSSNNPFYGRIRDLRVYDTALTDAELTALTSL